MLKTLSLCAALAIPQVSRADNARLYTVTEEVRGDVTFLITTAPGSEPLWGEGAYPEEDCVTSDTNTRICSLPSDWYTPEGCIDTYEGLVCPRNVILKDVSCEIPEDGINMKICVDTGDY